MLSLMNWFSSIKWIHTGAHQHPNYAFLPLLPRYSCLLLGFIGSGRWRSVKSRNIKLALFRDKSRGENRPNRQALRESWRSEGASRSYWDSSPRAPDNPIWEEVDNLNKSFQQLGSLLTYPKFRLVKNQTVLSVWVLKRNKTLKKCTRKWRNDKKTCSVRTSIAHKQNNLVLN